MHSSKAIAMVEPRLDWMRMLSSGPMKMRLPSMWELKVHSLLTDVAQLRQRKDLEAAAVGEDRSVPTHKFVQAAQLP